MADKLEDQLKDAGTMVKAGLGVLLRAALIGVGITVGTAVVGGLIVGTLGGGGLAITGGVFAGLFGGGYLGKFVAKNYVEKRSGPAIVVAGNLIDSVNKELGAPTGKGVVQGLEDLAKKFEEEAKKPAADATPVAAAPAPVAAEPKAPAATM